MSEHAGPALPRPDPARQGAPTSLDPAQVRAAYRAWLLTSHPDRGGDPEAFRAGLPAWRRALAGGSAEGAEPALVFHRTRRATPWGWWAERRAARRRPPRVR